MLISDWSSDVCSSDLPCRPPPHRPMPVTRQPRRTDWTDMAGIGVRHVNRKVSYDLAVIGAGSAGFSTAIIAAEHGAKVVLVRHGTIGGTCVHVVLVPSKTLTLSAEPLPQPLAAGSFSSLSCHSLVTTLTPL